MFGSCKGQWLLTFAILFAFSNFALALMLNEISKSGYEVSKGLEIPLYEVRSLTFEISRAYGRDFNDSNDITNISKVFALHGYHLNLDLYNDTSVSPPILHINGSLQTESVNITFVDKKFSRGWLT